MLNLIPIERNGRAPKAARLKASPDTKLLVEHVCEAAVETYLDHGFRAPWIGYLAERDGEIVGTCGFKGPPRNGRVEIAYYAFPDHEREGVGAAMALLLVMIAAAKDPTVTVAAQTLPGSVESSELLKKLGFSFYGPAMTLEDGKVWEWRRLPVEQATTTLSIRACG